jgi:ribosomal protein L7/L12
MRQDWNEAKSRLNSKIRVIKWYRKFKGIGLKEAKEIIDDLERAFQADRSG